MDNFTLIELKNWKLYLFIVFTIPIYILYYVYIQTNSNYIDPYWLMKSTYIPIVVTNVYIYYAASTMYIRKMISNFMVIRKGKKGLINEYVGIMMIHIILYITFVFIFPSIVFIKYITNFHLYIVFLILQASMIFIYECILLIIYMGSDRVKFLIILPPFINLIYHFYIILPLLGSGGI